jgi:hypothetical protein
MLTRFTGTPENKARLVEGMPHAYKVFSEVTRMTYTVQR